MHKKIKSFCKSIYTHLEQLIGGSRVRVASHHHFLPIQHNNSNIGPRMPFRVADRNLLAGQSGPNHELRSHTIPIATLGTCRVRSSVQPRGRPLHRIPPQLLFPTAFLVVVHAKRLDPFSVIKRLNRPVIVIKRLDPIVISIGIVIVAAKRLDFYATVCVSIISVRAIAGVVVVEEVDSAGAVVGGSLVGLRVECLEDVRGYAHGFGSDYGARRVQYVRVVVDGQVFHAGARFFRGLRFVGG